MSKNETLIPIRREWDCQQCPMRRKISGYDYPYEDFPSCPPNEMIAKIGSKPTKQQLLDSTNKYGLIFADQMQYYDDVGTNTPVTIFQCPNEKDGMPGRIIAEAQLNPKEKN